MDSIISPEIAGFAIEQLMQSPIGEKLEKTAETVQAVFANLTALYDKKDEKGLTAVKAATVMAFSILKKISEGADPKSFTRSDWADIAGEVSEYAILPDGQSYSVYIFSLYETYIRYSVNMISEIISQPNAAAIISLADELHAKSSLLADNQISEVQYTEDCLWISLEAMIKLLASTSFLCADKRISEFVPALADLAFEYGRMKLYQRELEIVNQFIESQYQLDNELKAQYEEYVNAVNSQAAQFNALIDNAFSDDFRNAFLSSVLLAEASGVDSGDILSTEDDIDSFFLD